MEIVQRKKKRLSKQKKKSEVDVPVDLLIDIFSRVPAKSIARFRCVSKLWGSILQCPDFTELFLTKSSSRPKILLTFTVNNQLVFYSLPQPLNPPKNYSVVATRYTTPFPKYVPSDFGCQSDMVCGLVFRQVFNRKVRVICNHATGEFLTLPKVKTKSNPEAKPDSVTRFYFGYDPINKQFKVLCITSSDTHCVLTLGAGKRVWRRIECKPHHRLRDQMTQICINGVLYYSAKMEGCFTIVSFDVRFEKFGFINCDLFNVDGRWTLINYKGKLGAYNSSYQDWDKKNFVLWVLEDAANHKWTRLVNVLPRLGKQVIRNLPKFIGMTRTGEVVFSSRFISNPLCVYYYNLERNTFRRFKIRGFKGFKGPVRIYLDYDENIIKLM